MPRPNIIDLRGKLPRNGVFPTRPLSAVSIFAVHYDGSDLPDPDNYDPLQHYIDEAWFHINKDWGGGAHGYGIEYVYKIDRKGQWYQVEDELSLTWNATNANTLDLPVCLDCGPNTPPNAVMLISLQQGLDWLCTERPDMPAGKGDVYGHGELTAYGNSTSCPGGELLAWVRKYRQGVLPAPPVPAPNRDEQAVTIFSVIGDETYKPVPNMVQIQELVQMGKHVLGA